ncbi:unnamed protein product [Prunus armeniaca]
MKLRNIEGIYRSIQPRLLLASEHCISDTWSTSGNSFIKIEIGRYPKVYRISWEPITFSEEEEKGVIFLHDDPMIIRAEMTDFDVGCILMDTDSLVNVLFVDAFKELGI